ncbi:hypothetical protein EDD86DRAFT_205672 [Gorgonomyces haynaldii]|nr:hypothetical protein EDD86DRAFT_205672 [Gorgonomyces haynaldii]
MLEEDGLLTETSIPPPLEDALEEKISNLTLQSTEKDDKAVSKDSKRKVLRQIFDLKRLLEKEGGVISSDSAIQKRLFAKSGPNVTVLVRAFKVWMDLECSHSIASVMLRILTTSESAQSNASFLAKRGLTQAIMTAMHFYHPEYKNNQPQGNAATYQQKLDEFNTTIVTLLVKLNKADPKLALMARISNTIPVLLDIGTRFFEKRDFSSMMVWCTLLKICASKNENNLIALQKSQLGSLIESTFGLSASYSTIRTENLLELVVILAKSPSWSQDYLKSTSMRQIFSYCGSPNEVIQKLGLKLIKTLVQSNYGAKQFQLADGPKVLTDILQNTLVADNINGTMSSPNSVPSLLVSVLRLTVKQADLPMIELITERIFPLPRAASTQPFEPKESTIQQDPNSPTAIEQTPSSPAKLIKYETIYTKPVNALVDHLELKKEFENLSELDEAVIDQLKSLCPELEFMYDVKSGALDKPNGNIRVRHVQPMFSGKHIFCKHLEPLVPEPLLKRSPLQLKKVIFEQTTKIFKNQATGVPVYNVMDPTVAEKAMETENCLKFESRFESGNLQLAIKNTLTEYELLIQSDINAAFGKHNQWFFFSVTNAQVNVQYKFSIMNLSKPGSQFNNGMQPVVYSVQDCMWKRMGEGVYYIKNHFRKSDISSNDKDGISDANTYATLSFSLTFKNPGDTYFIAYHYPYTYSDLQRFLYKLYKIPDYPMRCKRTVLCQTLGGNECPLLTITDFDPESHVLFPVKSRKYVFLSARVHPGESNSSHIMQGIIQFLLSDDENAAYLRKRCIFKIMPMLNPDGVVNGSHRCSLAGVDLNRQWKKPSRTLTPTIFWTKLLYRFLIKLKGQPLIACDFHGHSRKKNIFMFGNENPPGSSEENIEKAFPQILAHQSPFFDFNSCRFNIERSKESTARVVLFHEFGVLNSFTTESTYCGFDVGEKKGLQIQLSDLYKTGQSFCESLVTFMTTEHAVFISEANAHLLKRPIKSRESVSSSSSGSKHKKPSKKEEKEENPSDDSSSGDDEDDL